METAPTELAGRQGINFTASVAQGGLTGTYYGRTFVDGTTLYQLAVVGADDGPLTIDEVNEFFESFQFSS